MHLAYACAGMGLGAGLMYLMDPERGQHRREAIRDKAMDMTQQAEQSACSMTHQVAERARELASGNFSSLSQGKETLKHALDGNWSNSSRTLMAGIGAGLFLFGLTRSAPLACILGTVGAALTAEAITNASVADVRHAAGDLVDRARDLTHTTGSSKQAGSRQHQPQHAGV